MGQTPWRYKHQDSRLVLDQHDDQMSGLEHECPQLSENTKDATQLRRFRERIALLFMIALQIHSLYSRWSERRMEISSLIQDL